MMITEDFLLECKSARRLYQNYARTLPIIDFHCHLPPAEIAADRKPRIRGGDQCAEAVAEETEPRFHETLADNRVAG